MAWSDVILHDRLILFFIDHAAAEPLADARGTLGFRGTPVENHWRIALHGSETWTFLQKSDKKNCCCQTLQT